jgi:hypothetical protein
MGLRCELCTVRGESRRWIIKAEFESLLAVIGVQEAVIHNIQDKVEAEIKTNLD